MITSEWCERLTPGELKIACENKREVMLQMRNKRLAERAGSVRADDAADARI